MVDRAAGSRSARQLVSLDVVIVTLAGRELMILLQRGGGRGRERWALPFDTLEAGEPLEPAAGRLVRRAIGAPPAQLEQVGAFTEGKRHPVEAGVSVCYLAAVPVGTAAPPGGIFAWFPAGAMPALSARQGAMVEAALRVLRRRLDDSPIAFRLLPPTFTLTELQQVYEVLLGQQLHKASFRRALQAADLVEPTDEWRTEGRGRPAQLFRLMERRRPSSQRGVRFP